MSRPVNIRCDRPMYRAVVIVLASIRSESRPATSYRPGCFGVHGRVIADVDGGNRLYDGDKGRSSLGLRAEASERECHAHVMLMMMNFVVEDSLPSLVGGAVSALCSRTNECPATPSFLCQHHRHSQLHPIYTLDLPSILSTHSRKTCCHTNHFLPPKQPKN